MIPGPRARPPRLPVVFAVLVFLFLLTGLLANFYGRERQARSLASYRQGQQLAKAGSAEEAIEHYRGSLALSRNNQDARLALARSLMDAKQVSEAESHLSELLQRDPTSGLGNLLMARVAALRGRWPEAQTYYRRAIYGLWTYDPAGNRLAARFELAPLLAKQGSKRQLLAELLQLQEDAGDDRAALRRVAALQLQSGFADRAADLYRDLVRSQPRDAELLFGLGKAEYLDAKYLNAQRWLRATVSVQPEHPEAQRLLSQASGVLDLDPTLRRLSTLERFRRSCQLVEAAALELEGCPEGDAVRTARVTAARQLAAEPVRSSGRQERAEALLQAAEELWLLRSEGCRAAPPRDEIVRLVFDRILS